MRTGTRTDATHLPAATVTIDGEQLPVEAMKLERRIASDWPDGVIAGDGLTPTIADLTLGRRRDSGTDEPSPWKTGAGLPRQLQTATIDAATGTETHRLLTGRVDIPAGEIGGRVTVGLIDNIDRLNRNTTQGPQQHPSPPHGWDLPATFSDPVPTFNTREALASELLRQCGYHVSPPVVMDRTLLSVPMFGGLQVGRSDSLTGRGVHLAATGAASWSPGFGSNFTAEWSASIVIVSSVSRDLNVRTKASSRWRLEFTNGPVTGGWWLACEGGRILAGRIGYFASVDVAAQTGVVRAAVRSGRVEVFLPDGSSAGSVTVTTANSTAAETVKQVHANSSDLGWIDYSLGDTNYQGWQPNAIFETRGNSMRVVEALTGWENRRALDVLRDMAKSMGVAMWIDEDGVFRWVAAGARTAWTSTTASPAVTVRATDVVQQIRWEAAPQARRSRVSVGWQSCSVIQSPRNGSQNVWQAPSVTIEPAQTAEWWVRPDAGTEWVGMTSRAQWELPNRFERRVIPFACIKEGDEYRRTPEDQMPFTVERVGTQAVKIRLRNQTALPQANIINKGAVRDPSLGPGFHPSRWAGENTPLVPVWGITTWVDETTTAGSAAADVPELVHDAGRWLTASAEATALANFLHQGVQTPAPAIRGLTISPDPRIQLGDRVRVIDDARSGVTVDGIVFGITDTWAAGEWTQQLDLRVIVGTESSEATWAEVEAAWSPRTWNQVEAANNRTWQQMEQNPTQGAS